MGRTDMDALLTEGEIAAVLTAAGCDTDAWEVDACEEDWTASVGDGDTFDGSLTYDGSDLTLELNRDYEVVVHAVDDGPEELRAGLMRLTEGAVTTLAALPRLAWGQTDRGAECADPLRVALYKEVRERLGQEDADRLRDSGLSGATYHPPRMVERMAHAQAAPTIKLVARLRAAMSKWASCEDGLPDFAWDAYCEACAALGLPAPAGEEPAP